MDFSKGYTASFRAVLLDPSWSEGESLTGLTSISITKDVSSDVPLIDSADIDLDSPPADESYVRIYLDAVQDGGVTSYPLGTFLVESSDEETGAGSDWSTAELWSVLKPADELMLPTGWYAQKGAASARKAASLLSECIAAPVEAQDGSPSLAEHYVSDGTQSHLAAAWALLPSGWGIAVDGMGNVTVRENPSDPVPILASEIIGTVKESWNLAGIPNRVTVSDDAGNEATAVNTDPSSPTSTVARGRIIDGDGGGVRESGESLRAFAKRLLKEQSKVTRTCTYEREFMENVTVGSLVTIPTKQGAWRVTGQTITCGCGVRVSETAVREEGTWL